MRRHAIGDLTPLAGLTALQSLDCSGTQVGDLTPLAGLTALQSLDCRSTQVGDLTPLAGLTALQSLACRSTQVGDLTPLAGLTALQSLDCSLTQVGDLTPLAGLTALQSLDCSRCRLGELPASVRNLPSLQKLVLYGCQIPGVPAEVLSQGSGEDCLAAVRAHFRDLEAGATAATDVKLIVLGNGRVGKTQICRRLRGEDYDKTEKSTHGILVTSATLGDRVEHAAYWTQEYDRIDALVRNHGTRVLGQNGLPQLNAMMRFAHNVADILDVLSDTVRPTRWRIWNATALREALRDRGGTGGRK